MQNWMLRGLFLSLALGLVGVNFVEAAGPGGSTSLKKKKSFFTKTVTTTVLTDFLDNGRVVGPNGGPDLGTFDATAQFETVEVKIETCFGTWTTTHKTLTVLFQSTAVADGEVIEINLNSQANGEIALPPITMANGQAYLKLCSSNCDVVPDVVEGDSMDYDFLFQVTTSFGFGEPVVTVTTCGK